MILFVQVVQGAWHIAHLLSILDTTKLPQDHTGCSRNLDTTKLPQDHSGCSEAPESVSQKERLGKQCLKSRIFNVSGNRKRPASRYGHRTISPFDGERSVIRCGYLCSGLTNCVISSVPNPSTLQLITITTDAFNGAESALLPGDAGCV